MKPLIIHRAGEAILGRDGLDLDGLPQEFQRLYPSESPKYIDPLSLLAGVAAGRALKGYGPLSSDQTRRHFAVVLGSAFGAIDSSLDFDRQALLSGPNTVNPMDFPNTVANAAGSRVGIWLQLKGPNVTLTNGETSLIDAIGFAWEGYHAGLFQHCLVGAAEKVPPPLKPLADPSQAAPEFMEGAFLLASGEDGDDFLFQVADYFAVQMKPDSSLPKPFLSRFERLWQGASWLGCPMETALEPLFPPHIVRYAPNQSVLELGLSGYGSLKSFLSSSQSCGVVAVFSKRERKFSCIKIRKKED